MDVAPRTEKIIKNDQSDFERGQNLQQNGILNFEVTPTYHPRQNQLAHLLGYTFSPLSPISVLFLSVMLTYNHFGGEEEGKGSLGSA